MLQGRASAFLESKRRKSRNTAVTYNTGLKWLKSYIETAYPSFDEETVLSLFENKKLDIYRFLDSYVAYLMTPDFELKPASIHNFVYCAKSYFSYCGIDILTSRFKSMVTLPANRKEDEYPIDVAEARIILSNASNRRLRAFLFFLASAGPRPVEAAAIRYRDVEYGKPTKVYMRAEFSKNKLPREIYMTDEASKEMKLWDEYKLKGRTPDPDELVFAFEDQGTKPWNIYMRISVLFRDHLDSVNLGEWKDKRRRKITLYSFRRYVETVIEDHTSANYADYILGHKKSPYYSKKEPERRQQYLEKCERALTYLDYASLEKRVLEESRKAKSEEVKKIFAAMVEEYMDERIRLLNEFPITPKEWARKSKVLDRLDPRIRLKFPPDEELDFGLKELQNARSSERST